MQPDPIAKNGRCVFAEEGVVVMLRQAKVTASFGMFALMLKMEGARDANAHSPNGPDDNVNQLMALT